MISWCRLLCILLVVPFSFADKKLPTGWPRCYRDDPKLEGCLVKASNDLRDTIRHGVKELQIPDFNPYVLPLLKVTQGSANLQFNVTMTNATINGLENYNCTQFQFYPALLKLNGSCHFPALSLSGESDFNGKILFAALNGHGKITVKTNFIGGSFDANGELVTRKGEQYLRVKDAAIKFDKMEADLAKFENFGSENEEIVKILNRVISDNVGELLHELLPAVEDIARGLLRAVIEGVVKNVPYDKLFPLSPKS